MAAASKFSSCRLQSCTVRSYGLHPCTQEERPIIWKLAKTIAFVVLRMFVVSTLAVAAEMTCTKADEKGCTMAKGADGKEMAVIGTGMKMGDKMDCMSKDGKMECMKEGMMKK